MYPARRVCRIGGDGCGFLLGSRWDSEQPVLLPERPGWESILVLHLLVIGGISNRGDAGAVRSVIRQVRARKPDTEVLLLTPVFGALRDAHIRTYTREIDTTTDNFRYNMQKVAEEEKCAFFDMTGPWWEYIQNSGKTYGWFKGDAVHANVRGCRIIGRLLKIWFKQ